MWKESFLGWFTGLSCLGCFGRPSPKYFSLPTLFQFFGQAFLLSRLSLSMCLWLWRRKKCSLKVKRHCLTDVYGHNCTWRRLQKWPIFQMKAVACCTTDDRYRSLPLKRWRESGGLGGCLFRSLSASASSSAASTPYRSSPLPGYRVGGRAHNYLTHKDKVRLSINWMAAQNGDTVCYFYNLLRPKG